MAILRKQPAIVMIFHNNSACLAAIYRSPDTYLLANWRNLADSEVND